MSGPARTVPASSSRMAAAAGALLLLVAGAPARAQDPCAEPDDPEYEARMGEARTAIEADDFESARDHLLWAAEHYPYAVLQYSLARAFHRLGQWAEAEAAYTRFLRAFEGCPDPQELAGSARDYRSLAIAEQARALAQPPPVDPPADPPPDPQPDDPSATAAGPDPDAEASALVEPPPDRPIHPGWFVAGSGAALIVSAVIFDLTQAGLLDDRQAAADAGDLARFEELDQDVSTGAVVDGVLYGTGLAALAVGVVLLLVDESAPVHDEPGAAASFTAPFPGVRF